MKFYFIFLFLISVSQAFSLSQDNTKIIFCELVYTEDIMILGKVVVDIGEPLGAFRSKYKILVDAKGKVLRLNSMVDAMNYMSSIGWEFVQAYVIDTNDVRFLLRKTISVLEKNPYPYFK
ncbi:MAG: hypothetical protein M3Q56_05830 [Bacteroidota bacterium]|nr:hypothetical protein [Bacteroidota bacterium]